MRADRDATVRVPFFLGSCVKEGKERRCKEEGTGWGRGLGSFLEALRSSTVKGIVKPKELPTPALCTTSNKLKKS